MDKLREVISYLKKKGAEYADIRWVRRAVQGITVKNGEVERSTELQDQGFGIRVLVHGAWGFAASASVTKAELKKTANRAIALAKASASVGGGRVTLAEVEPLVATYRTPVEKDPFQVPLEAKLDLLFRATDLLRKDPRIRVAEGSLGFFKIWKVFVSTEGTEIEQEIIESGGGITATAVEGGEVQTRSYPASHGGDFATKGYEFIEQMDLIGNAERIREEALALLSADLCPSGEYTVILDGHQMALQIHESCGHAIELDRVLGMEMSYAGGSFLSLEKRRGFHYGSPLVNITADATIPGGLGTFGYDDEGVPAQRVEIVREGIFLNYLSSRETAAVLGERSNGCMRADGWNRIPLIRMVNVNLEPGQGTLEELLADTNTGLLLSTNKSWSIDQMRLNFQFGCEIAWEIKNGRLGRILKNPVYTGITPTFWGNLDAICGPESWHIWGVPNCGKGEPPQVAHVGHGTAPARFRRVQVGVKR
ncbi:MAG: TldD/PmbA family protein [Candidatus Methylomirabilales bacterium]